MGDIKFKFTTDFQFELLRYTALDKNGYKALELYDDSYFTLTEHAILAFTFKQYYKRKHRIPSSVIFQEELLNVFNRREFVNNLTDDDRKEIISLGRKMYVGIIRDGDEILANAEKFSQFVDLKNTIEEVDLLDYGKYDSFSKKVQKAISPKLKKLEDKGNFLVADLKYRQFKRQDSSPIVPTPFKQLNRLTNAGGYTKGSILVIMDKAKHFKTGMLINLSRLYLSKGKKNILVIDLDNGEDEWMQRLEQSISGKTKRQILSGDYDEAIQRSLRRNVKRFKAELVIKRMPALVTTAGDIDNYLEYLYTEFGIRIQILVVDYISKMGCISGKDSLHERISEAFIDIGNLAMKHGIEHVWTASHVKVEPARLRFKKKYDSTDIAGAIDITRHVQAIFGLNRTDEELETGLMRMEIVDQRDGYPNGRAVFKVNLDKQFVSELNSIELDKYYQQYRGVLEDMDKEEPQSNGHKRARKRVSDIDDQ
jgi:hypothetical protein